MGNSQGKEKKQELTILLMGKTGHGKSATGNSVLGRRNAFKVCDSMESETRKVTSNYAEFNNYTLKVVDGPGLADTKRDIKAEDLEFAQKNMEKALALCQDGVDAFVLVLRYGTRYTREERDALEALKQIFGETFLQHLIIVMTGGDMFLQNYKKQDFKSWCRKHKGKFQKLLNDCKERCVLFDNRDTNEEKMRAQRKELVDTVGTLNGRYTSECFRQAKRVRDKLILELKAPQLRETIQKKISLITADIDKLIDDPSSVDVETIGKRIQSLKEEIQTQDKGFGVLDDLQDALTEVTKSFNDEHELPRLRKKLERWRKAKIFWECFNKNPLGLVVLAFVPGGVVLKTAVVVTTTAAEIAEAVCTSEVDSVERNIQTMKT